ncbi:Sirohydrochlorin cobaltochelatase [Neorhodopirellula pilleata]|uniref:Sirohydrochlorin cobaltochelatase n=1 Tax=Neorhodopirellula pilleata TaxID=2714738 RepID=A0A5C5ZZY4_9BACT|nr:Sirohydrochlorin cobaltochelatase [Neorhodopirellula pilleata]
MLVGHGTRDRSGTEEFFLLGQRLSTVLSGQAVVAPCLLEFQEPTITQAWATLVSHQCSRVVVAPLLLFAAGHAKSDIPDEVAAAKQATPGSESVDVSFCPPISRQALMIDAVRQRLIEALETLPNDRVGLAMEGNQRTAIVMVGRGSRDVCASADMRVLSEIAVMGRPDEQPSLADQYGIARDGLHTTFYAMAEPRLPDTLDRVAASGRFDRIVVHPHLLFSGRLYEAIEKQVQDAAKNHPHVQFGTSAYLGPTDLVARAVAARIVEACSPPVMSV